MAGGTNQPFWVSPFGHHWEFRAKAATKATSPEPANLARLRELAKVHQSFGRYTDARSCWVEYARIYISEREHVLNYVGELYGIHNQSDTLEYRITNAVVEIINTLIFQKSVYWMNDGWGGSEVYYLYSFIEQLTGYEEPLALRTARILLHYCLRVLDRKDWGWLCKLYTQTLDKLEPISNSRDPNVIDMLQGMARAVVEQELEMFHSNYYQKTLGMDKKERQGYEIQEMARLRKKGIAIQERALRILQQLEGLSSRCSLDCGYELAMLYERTRDPQMAEATLRQMNRIAEQQLGDNHHITIRMLAALANLLIRKEPKDAGLVMYPFVTKHRDNIFDESILDSGLRRYEDYTSRTGWADMVRLNDRLSRCHAPFFFRWADHLLYTLPISHVDLQPVCPSEDEKNEVCSFRNGPDAPSLNQARKQMPIVKPSILRYKSVLRDDMSNILQVPYITYAHFSSTQSFIDGEPYLEYVKAPEDYSISESVLMSKESLDNMPIRISTSGAQARNAKRNTRHGLPITASTPASLSEHVKNSDRNIQSTGYPFLNCKALGRVSPCRGFLNGIPTDSALIHSDAAEPTYSLLSSKWADWQHFAIHAPPEDFQLPRTLSKRKVKCHGYISGAWTEDDLSSQKKIYRLYVVDAVFVASATTRNATYLAALSKEALSSSTCHELTMHDKRAFSARLNPSLYQLAPCVVIVPYSLYTKEMRSADVEGPSKDEIDLWAEMNRRERWDRDFERRKPLNEEDREKLKLALEEEDRQRGMWDQRFKGCEAVQTAEGTIDERAERQADSADTVAVTSAEGSSYATQDQSRKKRFGYGRDLVKRLRFLF